MVNANEIKFPVVPKSFEIVVNFPDHKVSKEFTGMVKAKEKWIAKKDISNDAFTIYKYKRNRSNAKRYAYDYSATKYYQPPYSKDELVGVLKRHRGTALDEKCDCKCPFTANSINMVLQFAFVSNEVPLEIRQASYDFLNYLTEKSCFVSKNPLTIAAFVSWLMGLCLRGRSYPKFFFMGMFYVKSNSILNDHLQTVIKMIGANWVNFTLKFAQKSANKITSGYKMPDHVELR